MSDAWKVGKEDKKGILREQEYCILVGVITKDEDEAQVMEYLDELDFLANTAGAITKKVFTQKMPHPNVKTFVGSGKLEEIREYMSEMKISPWPSLTKTLRANKIVFWRNISRSKSWTEVR